MYGTNKIKVLFEQKYFDMLEESKGSPTEQLE